MPHYQVELSDGRVFEVEADGPPSEADILAHIGGSSASKKSDSSGVGTAAKVAAGAAAVPTALAAGKRVLEGFATNPALGKVLGKTAAKIPGLGLLENAVSVGSGNKSIGNAIKDQALYSAIGNAQNIAGLASRVLPAAGAGTAAATGGALGIAAPLAFLSAVEADTKRDFSGVKDERGLRGSIFKALTQKAPVASVSTTETFEVSPEDQRRAILARLK